MTLKVAYGPCTIFGGMVGYVGTLGSMGDWVLKEELRPPRFGDVGDIWALTWTRTVCKIMVFWAVLEVSGHCFTYCEHLPVSRVVMYSISLLVCFACMYKA